MAGNNDDWPHVCVTRRSAIMQIMWKAFIALVLVIPAFAADQAARGAESLPLKAEDWKSLFNGKDFSGWYTHLEEVGNDRDPGKVFQVHEDVIHLYKDHIDAAAAPKGYFATPSEYSHYHLRFQYKWGAKKFPPRYEMPKDAGVMYHVTGADAVWPQCIECQVEERDVGGCIAIGGTGLTTTVGSVPLRRNDFAFKPLSEGGIEKEFANQRANIHFKKHGLHEVDGWNTVDLIVRGDREAIHMINGHVVFHAKNLRRFDPKQNAWRKLDRGRILFQAECAEVFYRNIMIRPLESGPLHPAPPVSRVRVPDGFEVIQVAGPPLVEYPTLACFDDRGRLYVSEGANVNDPYEVIKKTLPRSIRRLEDTDGDGVFDRATVFADKMTFPYGGVWHDGALYVASDPSIWRLEDTDDDGVADKREEIITGFGSEGHSSSVKGGYLGPDGWLYFAGGNERGGYNLKGRDGRHLHDPNIAPCVFRMKPDGTGLEFIANGAAGLYDLCFAPNGDLFGVVTILKYPRGDGLMHWVYGGAYQTSRSRSRYARFTGDRLPPLVEWAQTSPSGAIYYESGAFGDEYRGNLFSAHFNTHVVTRNVIEPAGGTWKSVRQENFVESSDLNCRFTDVLEDADGSLIVVNTGGWFRIGCPTSQVGDDALTGAIYRVRKIGQKAVDDPRGLMLDWSVNETTLAKRLEDKRIAVRDRAMAELARRGSASIEPLAKVAQTGSPSARCHAIWTLTRIDASGARAIVRKSLLDEDETVAKAATASVGLWRDAKAFELVLAQLKSPSAALRREAACALGRLGSPAAVPPLLQSLADAGDRFVEHAVIYALIEIDNPEKTLAGLRSPHPAIARGALIALDQMPSGRLTEDDLAPLLAIDDAPLQQAALEILSRKGWTKGVLPLLTRWFDEPDVSARGATLTDALRLFRNDRAVQRLIADRLVADQTPLATRKLLLEVMANSRLRRFPAIWQEPLETCLLSENQELVEEAIAVIGADGKGRFSGALQTLALDTTRPMPLRLMAASALLAQVPEPDDELFELLMAHCAAEETDAVTRLTIAKALGNARLTAAQLERMTGLVRVAGPLELPLLLRAYEESSEPAAGQKLFEALAASPGFTNLSPLRVQKLSERYPVAVQGFAKSLLARLSQQDEENQRRLEALSFALEGGDPVRGKAVFFGASACSQCHRVGNQGSGVGPDLSRIGEIRTRRDLLEAIVLPSATLARGYEPVTIITTDGRPISGIIRSETTRELILMTADRSELAIGRSEIDEIAPSQVSIMPQGLDRNLKPDELKDLLAFLASLRGG